MSTNAITQSRNGDCIEFRNSSGQVVTDLFDGHDQICFDDPAYKFAAALGIEGATDWRAHFSAIGLDAHTARMIDAMPVPDRSL